MVIADGGPTALMLACELRLAEVEPLPRLRAGTDDQSQIPDFPNGPWLPQGGKDWGGKSGRSGAGSHWVRGS